MRDLRGLVTVAPQGFSPPDFSCALLRRLEDIGVDRPVLFGGALRDAWMGIAVSDYDVWGHCQNIVPPGDAPADTASALADFFCRHLPEAEKVDYEIREIIFHDGTMLPQYKLSFFYQGRDVSLFLDHHPLPLEQKIRGDAPINTIVMDSSGRVRAHPLFEAHARQEIFQPYNHHYPGEDERRFRKLKAKIPGLKYAWGSWTSLHSFYRPRAVHEQNVEKEWAK